VKRDIIVSLICLAAVIFLYYTLGWIDEGRAREFPRVVILITGGLSVLLFLQSLIIKKVQETEGKPFPWGRFLFMFGLILVYLYFMESVGFYVSAFLFFILVTLIFGRKELNVGKAASRIGMSVVFTGVLYLLFKVILKVQTPSGVLF
jgi:hypothetical protein